jgi:hypothetical protein
VLAAPRALHEIRDVPPTHGRTIPGAAASSGVVQLAVPVVEQAKREVT